MGDRDYDSRKVLRAIEANLEAGRLTPEQVVANIEALEDIRDNSKDPRARNRAVKMLMEWHRWMTEYERPVAQVVDHNHNFPTSIEIKTTHTHELSSPQISDKAAE